MTTTSDIQDFDKNGFAIVRGFYDVEKEIRPIQEGIREIVALMAKKHSIEGACETPEQAMAEMYPKLVKVNRAWGGEIYDAVKQIPEFVALVACKRNAELFEKVRVGGKAGVAAGGYGIRIDNPNEEKFRAWWHQDFPAQLRSYDGMVFWSPLLAVTQAMGPVQICVGSHVEGFVQTYDDDAGLDRAGAYALRLQGEEEILKKYEVIAPLTNPGDLLIFDYFLLHQSGYNVSQSPRWSMQLRYFNYRDPLGIKISWKGSFAAGEKFADIVPEIVNKGKQ